MRPFLPRLGLSLAIATTVAGCATSSIKPPASAPPPPSTSPHVEMAPIPNPERTAAPPTSAAEPRHYHSGPAEAPPPRVAPATPERAPAHVDPKRAAQLRAAGLEQLNRGAINRAITLLKQANALNPGNALIQRDLDRALRIARALQAKP